NLGIFNRVEIEPIPTQKGIILVVTVSEMWYLFPYPIIFRNERDWERISIGAGLLHLNFRGRREIIDFSFWLGFNPAVKLTYTNPWIFGRLKFYTSFSIFAKKVRNQSFTVLDSIVNENQIGFDWRIGKRFGHFTFLDISFGYKQLTLSPDDAAVTLSASGKDKLPHVGVSFTYDSRDLWEYAHKGHYFKIWARKTGWFGNVVDYVRFGGDVRKYFPLGPTTLAFRAATNLSQGKIPVYDQVHFGFLTRIRGHFSDRRTGDNLALGSAEFRFPLLKITYHNLGLFESMGRYGTNFRFGISGALFLDTGAVWLQNEKLTKSKFISGWGAGLHFFLPYMNLLRVEYGFNEDWDGQIIVDAFITF
ncbi:MAG: BamA/TamA family outer membrane protein, partial [bacterium]